MTVYRNVEIPDYFFGVDEEIKSADQAGILIDDSYLSLIKITGSDRISVLHNILTNDIAALKPGFNCYAMLLNAQGKILSDMTVLIFEDHVVLMAEIGMEQILIDRLQQYVFTEDIVFAGISKDYVQLRILGPRAGDILSHCGMTGNSPLEAGTHQTVTRSDSSITLVKKQFPINPEVHLLLPVHTAAGVVHDILDRGFSDGLCCAGYSASEMIRRRSGVLRFGIDFDERTFLSETGLQYVAVSWTKGCYPGQEVVARWETYKKKH